MTMRSPEISTDFVSNNEAISLVILLQSRYFTANKCTYPGYSYYPFPSNLGNTQDGLSKCTIIFPDENEYPGKGEHGVGRAR
jgi:hypothetical protein